MPDSSHLPPYPGFPLTYRRTTEKEYLSLTSGKILELPEELEKELDDLGIHTVYGMEWLKKNGYSQKKNQMLVRKNPFLPYA